MSNRIKKKPKICFFLNNISKAGGIESTVIDFANYLNKKNYEVSCLSLYGSSKGKYPLNDSVKSFSIHLSPILSFCRIGELTALLLLLFNRADIIICNSILTNLIGCIVGLFSRKKIIIRDHGYTKIFIEEEPKFYVFLIKQFFKKSSACVCLSQDICSFYKNEFDIPEGQIFCIPNPLRDIGCYDLEEEIEIFDLLAVGRLEIQKNYGRMFRIFKRLLIDYPDIKLLVCGEGYMRNKLQDYIKELGIENNVILKGFVKNLAPYYKTAKALLLTSNYEGQPTVFLEAMSYGCPCITFNFGGEVIKNYVNGVLVNEDDDDAFLKEIKILLEDQKLREKYSKKCLETVKSFSQDKLYGAWEKLFSGLLLIELFFSLFSDLSVYVSLT